MTLDDWLRRLERLHYKAIDMGLERVSRVARQLDLLQGLPFIFTVGGTNGKGSTVAFLEAILLAQGLRVGTYTSPHLIAFNERVRVNGNDVDDAALIGAFEQIEAARGDISLTYFEFTTLAAMLVFKQQALDALVLEVGLGGRLDAVNIWDADVAMVTSIDLDHQQFLGDTRDKIGLEKIGIGRPGKPLIIAERNLPELVQQSALALGMQVLRAGIDFDASEQENSLSFQGQDRDGNPVLRDSLPVPHLYWQNAVTALQALALSPFELYPGVVASGLATAALTGRQQIVERRPDVMLDVGHNPQAAAHLARRLTQLAYPRVHCVIGMLKDKAVADSLAELLPVVDVWYPVTLPGERGQDCHDIEAQILQAGGLVGFCDSSAHQAYRRLRSGVRPEDLILVFGSFYTVADVIQYRRDNS